MYTISGYGSMIADHVRIEAYAQALRLVVRPGSVVADLGTGTGIMAFLACQCGARRVFAIEPDNSIQVARELARANGFADRVEFFQDLSTRVTLPEPADVIVSDLRGMLPWFQRHIPAIVDARKRLLRPGGTLIPLRDTMWAALVEAPEPYGKLVEPWDNKDYGLDLRAARHIVLNAWSKARVQPEQLLCEPQCWATLDYAVVENPNGEGAFTASVTRTGTAHGILVWFDTELAEGIGFSNAPHAPELIYGSALFPWLEPVPVEPGDVVTVVLRANLVGEDYIWRWHSRVLAGGSESAVKAEFQQSTFLGVPVVPSQLRKRAANYVPALNEDGEIDQFILSLMGTGLSVSDIVARVLERFPQRFARPREALNRVCDLSQKYSR